MEGGGGESCRRGGGGYERGNSRHSLLQNKL